MKKPELSLISYQLCQEQQTYWVTIANTINQTLKIPVHQLTANDEDIKKFSPEDAHKIGYMTGLSEVLKENIWLHQN